MELHLLEGRECGGYTTFGAVWSRGEQREKGFLLTDETGKPIPVQSRIQARWPDGSVKWSAHTADSRKMGRRVRLTGLAETASGKGENIARRQGNMYLADTGKLTLEIPVPEKESSRALAQNLILQDGNSGKDGRQEKFAAKAVYPVFVSIFATDLVLFFSYHHRYHYTTNLVNIA